MEVLDLPCGAEAVEGGGDGRQVERGLRQRAGQDGPEQPDAGEGQVIEGDVEEGVGCGFQIVPRRHSKTLFARRSTSARPSERGDSAGERGGCSSLRHAASSAGASSQSQ